MKIRFLAPLAGLLLSGSLHAEPIAVGAAAPATTGTDQNGGSVDFAELYKAGYVLVYFYPKADTPGCTAQACSIRDDYEALLKRGVRVIGVSADDVAAQKAFEEKYRLPFTLIADMDKKVISAFGVPTNLMGFSSRQAFLVKDGIVVWRDLKAKTKEQAADVLAALDSFGKPAAGA